MRRRRSFLAGRSGPDALSMVSSLLACGLLLISLFTGGLVSSALWLLALGCLVYSYYRILSRNITKRRRENQWFLQKVQPLTDLKSRWEAKRRRKKLYCFFGCPQCATVLRVPKGKGRIRITCRCCGCVFERNS